MPGPLHSKLLRVNRKWLLRLRWHCYIRSNRGMLGIACMGLIRCLQRERGRCELMQASRSLNTETCEDGLTPHLGGAVNLGAGFQREGGKI